MHPVSTTKRQRLALLCTISLLFVGVMAPAVTDAAAVVGGSAAGGSDHAAASRATHWLAGRLPANGAYENPLSAALPDYGLTLDVLTAMYASRDGDLGAPIVEMFDDQRNAVDYVTWAGLVPDDPDYTQIITAGSAAKMLFAASMSDRDPHDFGGLDLVQETIDTIVVTDIEPLGFIAGHRGRIRDYSKLAAYETSVINSANVFGQALAVIGLAGTGASFAPDEPAGMALSALVGQQCADGYFRVFFTTVPYTDPAHPTVTSRTASCDEAKAAGGAFPDGDATALSLSAMITAKRAGATGMDAPIARAVEWLESNQRAGGGWGGGVSTDGPNANSTGLVVQALQDAGGDPQVIADGVDYLRGLQLTSANSGSSGLQPHIGAIAYNQADFDAAIASGSIAHLDTWIRSTAQAALGLAQVGFSNLVQRTVPARIPESTAAPTTVASTTAPPTSPVGSDLTGDAATTGASRGDTHHTTQLARTGSGDGELVALGLLLVSVGAVAVASGRRRGQSRHDTRSGRGR